MTLVIGREAELNVLRQAESSGRLHHAWLFIGSEGVGKATLAHEFACRLLAKAVAPDRELAQAVPENHPTAQLMAALTHPDFLRIERLPRDEKIRDTDRRDWPIGVERVRSISVDQIRRMTSRFSTAPTLSSRRVVVIDSVDDLERPAANALLKSLEEPPKGTIFLLISHAPGRLLPTIRSRCRTLRLGKMARQDVAAILREELSEDDTADLDELIDLADGAPGKGLVAAGLKLRELDEALTHLARSGDKNNAARLALAKSLSGKSAQPRYEAFLRRAPSFIANYARTQSGPELAVALEQWAAARHLAQSAVHASLDPHMVVFALGSHVAALAPSGGGAMG